MILMRLSFFALICVLLSSNDLYGAETPNPTPTPAIRQKEEVPSETGRSPEKESPRKKASREFIETRDRRAIADYFVLGNYSPWDLLIPSKYGLTLGLIRDADKSWEFEYLRGSISVPLMIADIGSMTDERYSLIGRSYFGGNSFNFSYGLTYFNFSLHLGDKLISRLTGGTYPSVDLVEIQSFGFNVAVGNRWTFSHDITFSVDWISWAQPVLVTNKRSAFLDQATNQQDRNDVETALKIISYFPRFALLKLQLGILF